MPYHRGTEVTKAARRMHVGWSSASEWAELLPELLFAEAAAALLAGAAGGAAAGGGLQRGTGEAASGDSRGRITVRDRRGGLRAGILAVAAPVQSEIAQRDTQIARRAQRINVRLIEAGGDVGFDEIIYAANQRRVVGDGHVEDAVGGGDVDVGKRSRRSGGAGGIDSGAAREIVDGVHDAAERIGQARVGGFDVLELGEEEHYTLSTLTLCEKCEQEKGRDWI